MTARSMAYNKVTREWLARHGFPDIRPFHTMFKAGYAKLLKADWLIEDKPAEIAAASREGVPAICFAQPYNTCCAGLPGVVRVGSWSEVCPVIGGAGVEAGNR
jgi:5'(3')-deoxyribonucleotidase